MCVLYITTSISCKGKTFIILQILKEEHKCIILMLLRRNNTVDTVANLGEIWTRIALVTTQECMHGNLVILMMDLVLNTDDGFGIKY